MLGNPHVLNEMFKKQIWIVIGKVTYRTHNKPVQIMQ